MEKYVDSCDPDAKRFNNLWITGGAFFLKNKVIKSDCDDFNVVTLDYEDAQTLRHFLEHGFSSKNLFCPNICDDTVAKIRSTLSSTTTGNQVHVSNETVGNLIASLCTQNKRIGVFNLDYTCTWAGNKDMRPMHDVARLFQIPSFHEVWMLCVTISTREPRCDSNKWCTCKTCDDYDSVNACLHDVRALAKERNLELAVYRRSYGKNMVFLGFVVFQKKHRNALQQSIAFQECDFSYDVFHSAKAAPACFLRTYIDTSSIQVFINLIQHDSSVQALLGQKLCGLVDAHLLKAVVVKSKAVVVKAKAVVKTKAVLNKLATYKLVYLSKHGKMRGRPPLGWNSSREKRDADKFLGSKNNKKCRFVNFGTPCKFFAACNSDFCTKHC